MPVHRGAVPRVTGDARPGETVTRRLDVPGYRRSPSPPEATPQSVSPAERAAFRQPPQRRGTDPGSPVERGWIAPERQPGAITARRLARRPKRRSRLRIACTRGRTASVTVRTAVGLDATTGARAGAGAGLPTRMAPWSVAGHPLLHRPPRHRPASRPLPHRPGRRGGTPRRAAAHPDGRQPDRGGAVRRSGVGWVVPRADVGSRSPGSRIPTVIGSSYTL